MDRTIFGVTRSGQQIEQFRLSNSAGMSVHLINLGAIVTSVRVPDRRGTLADVALGFPDLAGYEANAPYFGAICGRFANRIAGGYFEVDGVGYQLEQNDPPNTLHGGGRGFDKQVWTPVDVQEHSVRFEYLSPAGEEGYPGALQVQVNYRLTEEHELWIEYTAESDCTTPVNLTNHSYWNLAGTGPECPRVLEHELQLACDSYLAVDATLIPTGEYVDVGTGPMNFRERRTLASGFADVAGGYDHCFVVNRKDRSEPVFAARLYEPQSGRWMQVSTTEPGIQIYTGNFLEGTPATGGYGPQQGICLECQQFPDAPNRPEFPSTLLRPGSVYRQTTIHQFGTE